jgi:hypothetical protein
MRGETLTVIVIAARRTRRCGGSVHFSSDPVNKESTMNRIVSKSFIAVAAAVAASLLLVTPVSAGPPASKACKLGGVWVAKVVEAPAQWSYIVAADASGRRASAHGTVDVGLYVPGINELADSQSPFLIDIVATGPDTAQFNSVWYGLKETVGGVTTAEVVYIGVDWGELKCVAPGKSELTHNIEFYLPDADGDNDGYPDPGAIPIGGAQVHTVDTRLGQH